jgi:hypothetical protein
MILQGVHKNFYSYRDKFTNERVFGFSKKKKCDIIMA